MLEGVTVGAIEKISRARPRWTGLVEVAQVTGAGRLLLHAGPPFERKENIPKLLKNSLAFACIYEGWAKSWDEADALVMSEDVQVHSGQDYGILLPLAGVASPSMKLVEVAASEEAVGKAWSVLNEGATCASRTGQRNQNLPEHHAWLNGTFSAWLASKLSDPIDLFPILAEAIRRGDDCHATTMAGSKLLAKELLRREGGIAPDEVRKFLETSTTFALNIWMAMSAAVAGQARGSTECSIVVQAGGNGHDFGLKLASDPRRWFTVKAPRPVGNLDPGREGHQVAKSIGDSAMVDLLGLGGQLIGKESPVFHRLQHVLPKGHLEHRERFKCARLSGLSEFTAVVAADRVVEVGQGPVVLLGMLDPDGREGRIGGGMIEIPIALFEKALQDQHSLSRETVK